MHSITYNVDVYPDDFVEYISDTALIEEFNDRIENTEFYKKFKNSEDFNYNDIITQEDYKILREIFINHRLDESHNEIYEKILSKVM